MSGRLLKFEELDDYKTEQTADKATKEGFGVSIEVAGKGKTEAKTIQCERDNRGLIKISFKEGGKLPAVLAGRFTDIKSVKEALSVWKARRDKEFSLDENVTAPLAGGGQSIDDLVEKEYQENPPAFSEPLDEALSRAAAGNQAKIDAIIDIPNKGIATLMINGKEVVLDSELSA